MKKTRTGSSSASVSASASATAAAAAAGSSLFLISRALFTAALASAAFFLYLLRDFPRIIDPLIALCIAAFLLAAVWRMTAHASAGADACAFDLAVLVWLLQFLYRVIAGVQLYANAFYYADTLKIDADDAVGSMLQYMAHAHQTNLITIVFQILCGLIFFLAVTLTFVRPLMTYTTSVVVLLPYAASCFSAALFMATVPYGNRFALSDDALITFVFRTVLFLGAVLVEQHNLAANTSAATTVTRYMWLLFLTPYTWFMGIGVVFASLFVNTPHLPLHSVQGLHGQVGLSDVLQVPPTLSVVVHDDEKREKHDLELTQIDLGSTKALRRRTLQPIASQILALFDAKCTTLIDDNLHIHGASIMNSFRDALVATEQQNLFTFVDGNDDVLQMQGATYNTYDLFAALLQQHIAREQQHASRATPTVIDTSDNEPDLVRTAGELGGE